MSNKAQKTSEEPVCSFCYGKLHASEKFMYKSKIRYIRALNTYNNVWTHIWYCERSDCQESMRNMLGNRQDFTKSIIAILLCIVFYLLL